MHRQKTRPIATAAAWLLPAISIFALLASTVPANAVSQTALAVPLSGIRLDGDLSDWPRGIPTQPMLNHFDAYGRTDLAGQDLTQSQDLTPVMMVGYDANVDLVYLGVEVRDDVNYNPPGPNHLQSDGLEIYVSGLAGDAPGQQPTKYVMVPGDHQFVGFQGSPALRNGVIGRTRTRSVWRRQGDITTYEWQIDVFDRPGQRTDLIAGDVIGFDAVIVDHDGPRSGNPAWVPWGPAVGNKWTGNDRIGRLLLGGGPSFGSGMTFESKDLVRSAWGARTSSLNHSGDRGDSSHDEALSVAVHGIGGLVAGILAGVQDATDDDHVIEWMRQEGASEEDLAELRAGLLEAQQELSAARIELRREFIDVDVDLDARLEEDVHSFAQARVAQAIAHAAAANALSAADASQIHIPEIPVPPVPPVPPLHPAGFMIETDDGDFVLSLIWSSVLGLAMLIGAIGLTVVVVRRSNTSSAAPDASVDDRIGRIEQRLTDTQDVMIALSEKLDRLDEKSSTRQQGEV